jgi:DNA-binding beta-propeller fold protein YncE
MEIAMRKVMYILSVASLGLFGAFSVGAQPAAGPRKAGAYHVATVFHVGGEGGWDYLTVDSEHKLLYVPRTTHTLVIDANTGKTVADIPGQQRNHGVALVPDVGRGFISDGKEGTVTIFDLKTHAVLGKIKAADDADGIVYDRVCQRVLVSCGDANVLIPIAPDVDPKTGKADDAVPLGGKPEFLVSDGRGRIYVALEDKDQIAVVDTRTMKAVEKWPTAPGGAPVGMSMDPEHRRLFVGCRNPQKLLVMNADDGKVLADLPIGAGVDATRFDNGYIFASCRDGTLAVAREASPGQFKLVQSLNTKPGAKTMGIDPATHLIYLPTAELGTELDARSRPIPKPDTFMILVVGPSRK